MKINLIRDGKQESFEIVDVEVNIGLDWQLTVAIETKDGEMFVFSSKIANRTRVESLRLNNIWL